MALIIILLNTILSKIVIVDDIGLSQSELQKLKEMKGSFIKDKIKKHDDVLEFPKDFVNQKNIGNEGNINTKEDTSNDAKNSDSNNKTAKNSIESFLKGLDQDNSDISRRLPSKYNNNAKNKQNNNGLNDDYKYNTINNSNSLYGNNANDLYGNDRNYDHEKYQNKRYDPSTKSRDLFEPTNISETLSNEKNLVRQEKENIIDANRARTSLIDLKLNESKQRQTEIERTIYELNIKHDTILQKLKQRKDEQEQINVDVITLKNRKSNLSNSKRKIELERDKIEASLRLIGNEIAHLNKQLDDLKTKSLTVKDEKEVYDNRLRQHEEDLSDVTKRLNGEEMRQTEYIKEVNGLETINLSLKSQLEDLKIKKSREDSVQDRLEMERDRIVRNSITFS